MKKWLAIVVLFVGFSVPVIRGAGIADSLDEILTLVDKAPGASTQAKADLNDMKIAVRNKKPADALIALASFLNQVKTVLNPSANLLASLGQVSLISRRIPKITEGTLKIKSLANTVSEATDQVNDIAELVSLMGS